MFYPNKTRVFTGSGYRVSRTLGCGKPERISQVKSLPHNFPARIRLMKGYFISIKNCDFLKKFVIKTEREDEKIYAKEKTVDFSLDCHVKNLFQVLVVVKMKEKGDDGRRWGWVTCVARAAAVVYANFLLFLSF